MNIKTKQLRTIITLGLLSVVSFGTYNALMINSESNVSNIGSLKRLDEMGGVVIEGRKIAVEKPWQKIGVKNLKTRVVKNNELSINSAVVGDQKDTAAIQNSLELKLAEVINPKKWTQPLHASQFSGNITANDGIIESLNVSLPGVAGVSVSFAEMTGNVFEYEHNGEIFSGLMYQLDQNSYMVTLTNGPLEGTKLRFQGGESNPEQTQQYLAETHNVEIGVFGQDTGNQENHSNYQVSSEVAPAAAFNFGQEQSI